MNPREVGLEAFDLAVAVAMTPEQALHTGLDAAVTAARREFIVSMRDDLLLAAEKIDANEDNDLNDDGPAALIFMAMALDQTLPQDLRKGDLCQ